MKDDYYRKRKSVWTKFAIDGVLLGLSFCSVYLIKYGNLNLDFLYRKFVPIYFFCWLFSGLISGKFKTKWRKRRNRNNSSRLDRLRPFYVSILIFAGLLSLFLNNSQWFTLSRGFVFGSLAIYLILEITLLSGIFFGKFIRREDSIKKEFSIFFFLFEFLLISMGCFALQFYKMGTLRLEEEHKVILSTIFFLWIFFGLVIHKFQIPNDRNYLTTIWPFIKSSSIILFMASLLVFFFRIMVFFRLILGYLAVFISFEILIVSLYFLYKRRDESDVSERKLVQEFLPEDRTIQELVEKEKTESKEYLIPRDDFQSKFIKEKLRNSYLRHHPEVFNFIDHVIDLSTIDILSAEVLDSGNPYNIEILEDNSLEFLLNLHELNTFGRLDQYLIEINQKMKDNGFFVSKFEPREYRYLRFRKKYPQVLANIIYFFDFIWRQAFPKIPILNRIYYTVTRGRNRVLSLAEGFGRLYFCGFEILSLEAVDNYVYFVVKKAKDPYIWFKYFYNFNRVPSYGLFFKQRRIGKNKKPIYIYKLQTMYPYSEFIHQYVLELNNLDESGKIKDDFRITPWGKIFRKLWLDEIPMLINFIKGDIKFVGVRPLSQTFFSTYPKDLQDERTKYKPGLIPPYYADLPQNIDEVLESERKYLKRYKRNPFKTDLFYFMKAFKNIVIHGAKSG